MRPATIVTALAIAGFAMGSAVAQQAPAGQAFCLLGTDGSKNCGFATMAQCEQAKQGQATNSTCVRNAATTGSGAMSPSPVPSQPRTGMEPSNPSGPPSSAQPTR